MSTISQTGSVSLITNGQTTVSTAPTLAPDVTKCANGDGVWADPSSGCKNYYICAFINSNNPIVQGFVCADGYLFDDNVRSCNFASAVKCSGSSVITPATTQVTTAKITTTTTTIATDVSKCLNGDGIYADPATGCKTYYICAFVNTFRPIVQIQSCPDGYLYDNALQACNYAPLVKCAGATTTTTTTTATTTKLLTTPDLSKCPNGDGYYQDISSGCKNYYICAFTNTIRPLIQYYSCDTGLLFDNVILACNTASAVKCPIGKKSVFFHLFIKIDLF